MNRRDFLRHTFDFLIMLTTLGSASNPLRHLLEKTSDPEPQVDTPLTVLTDIPITPHLVTVPVTNSADSGVGSLRYAVALIHSKFKLIPLQVGGYCDIASPIRQSGKMELNGASAPTSLVVRAQQDVANFNGSLNFPASSGSPGPSFIRNISFAHNRIKSQSASNMVFGPGHSDILIEDCTFRHTGDNLLGADHVGDKGDVKYPAPMERIIFHRCLFYEPYSNHPTAVNFTGYYNAKTGMAWWHQMRKVLFYECVFIKCSHRNPLFTLGDPLHPELGGGQFINCIVYDYNHFASGTTRDSLADFRYNLYVRILGDVASGSHHDCEHQIKHDYNDAPPSLHVSGNELWLMSTEGTRNKLLRDYEMWVMVDQDSGQSLGEIPMNYRREMPLDTNWAANLLGNPLTIERDLSVLWSKLVNGKTVGARLPRRTLTDEMILTDAASFTRRGDQIPANFSGTTYASVYGSMMEPLR